MRCPTRDEVISRTRLPSNPFLRPPCHHTRKPTRWRSLAFWCLRAAGTIGRGGKTSRAHISTFIGLKTSQRVPPLGMTGPGGFSTERRGFVRDRRFLWMLDFAMARGLSAASSGRGATRTWPCPTRPELAIWAPFGVDVLARSASILVPEIARMPSPPPAWQRLASVRGAAIPVRTVRVTK